MEAKPVEIKWNSGMSIFASEKFLRSVSDKYGWLAGIDDEDNIRFILPYTIIHRAKVRMVRFRVETMSFGNKYDEKEERYFLNSVVSYFRSVRADVIIPGTTNAIFRTYPSGAIAAPYGTYIVELDKEEESIFMDMSSSHRRKIRLAEKAKIQVKQGLEYAIPVYELIRDTFKRSGLPYMSCKDFEKQVDSLAENVKIFVAEYNGSLQGGMLVPFSHYSAYYAYGGSTPEPVAGSMNMMHWEAMRAFKKMGVKRYDLCGVRLNPKEGSKQDGLKKFKERFGAKLTQGFMWKYSINPIKSLIYTVAVRLERGGDIVDAERQKLKQAR